jgi:hypothetical protein
MELNYAPILVWVDERSFPEMFPYRKYSLRFLFLPYLDRYKETFRVLEIVRIRHFDLISLKHEIHVYFNMLLYRKHTRLY